MAITIRGGAPARAASVSTGFLVNLTGIQQPQNGDLLVIFHGNDFNLLSNMDTPTVGGSSTGVTAITNGTRDNGADANHVKSWTYKVTSTGDLTVRASENGTAAEEKSLVVWVLGGADADSPIDGGSAGASNNGSAVNTSPFVANAVIPSGSDALLLLYLVSWNPAAPFTPPGGAYVEAYDEVAPGVTMGLTGGYEQLASAGSTGTRTITPSASEQYAVIMVAIKTAGSGSAQRLHVVRHAYSFV